MLLHQELPPHINTPSSPAMVSQQEGPPNFCEDLPPNHTGFGPNQINCSPMLRDPDNPNSGWVLRVSTGSATAYNKDDLEKVCSVLDLTTLDYLHCLRVIPGLATTDSSIDLYIMGPNAEPEDRGKLTFSDTSAMYPNNRDLIDFYDLSHQLHMARYTQEDPTIKARTERNNQILGLLATIGCMFSGSILISLLYKLTNRHSHYYSLPPSNTPLSGIEASVKPPSFQSFLKSRGDTLTLEDVIKFFSKK